MIILSGILRRLGRANSRLWSPGATICPAHSAANNSRSIRRSVCCSPHLTPLGLRCHSRGTPRGGLDSAAVGVALRPGATRLRICPQRSYSMPWRVERSRANAVSGYGLAASGRGCGPRRQASRKPSRDPSVKLARKGSG